MIHAVILAGGWGRRFWPRSRKKLPKQLLYLESKHSPIQKIFKLIQSTIPRQRIWVVANQEYAPLVRRQLPKLLPRRLLIEPQAKNTAAAIGLASFLISKIDPQALTIVLSSDQRIRKERQFLQTLNTACRQALKTKSLLAIGIRPHRPAQEFGYLKIVQSSKCKVQSAGIYKVEKFIEKPNIKKAKNFLRSKNYFWNSGIFVWQLSAILPAFKKYLPQLYAGLQRIAQARGRPGFRRQLLKEYRKFKDISIDYGILEKARNIYTVEGNFSWQDLGTWTSLFDKLELKDKQSNIIQGLHQGLGTKNSVIIGDNKHLIATLGLRDTIIVHTPQATLVCRKDYAQDVKRLTELLEKDKRLRKYL